MTHWREFVFEVQDDPSIPDDLTGQIILHLTDGHVMKYNVNATGRPKDCNGVVNLSKARRLTGSGHSV